MKQRFRESRVRRRRPGWLAGWMPVGLLVAGLALDFAKNCLRIDPAIQACYNVDMASFLELCREFLDVYNFPHVAAAPRVVPRFQEDWASTDAGSGLATEIFLSRFPPQTPPNHLQNLPKPPGNFPRPTTDRP